MQNYIDPKTLARVKDLPLVARSIAEGFLHGLHASRQRGLGIEFNQYRSYEPGDELSRVDWKLFARSDRYFVREAEKESEIPVWFLLDNSASMRLESLDKTEPSWNKFDYAKHLVASLAFLAQKQGDPIGYLSLSSLSSGEKPAFLHSASGESHWRKLLSTMEQASGVGIFPQSEDYLSYLQQMNRRSMVFIISDFHQNNNEITDFIKRMDNQSAEIIALQLLDKNEQEFNYQGAVRFRDLETQQELLVTASEAKAAYQENFSRYQQNIKEQLLKQNVIHQLIDISKPLDSVLFDYLQQRQKIRR